MTKKNRNVLIIAVILIVLGIIILLINYLANPKIITQPIVKDVTEVIDPNKLPILQEPNAIDSSSQVQPEPLSNVAIQQQQRQIGAKAMAVSFAERLGSYSNDSDFTNIDELMQFMTDDMKAWATAFVKDQRASLDEDAEYFGITTRVVSNDFKRFDFESGIAKLSVKTQRIEYRGTKRESKVYYQSAIINLLKIDERWFVDEVIWQ